MMKKRNVAIVIILITNIPMTMLAKGKKKQVTNFINTMKSARVIELNFIWDRNSPLLGLNPPFTIGLQSSHRQTKVMIPSAIDFAADMMVFSGQHGSPT